MHVSIYFIFIYLDVVPAKDAFLKAHFIQGVIFEFLSALDCFLQYSSTTKVLLNSFSSKTYSRTIMTVFHLARERPESFPVSLQ